MDLQLLLNGPLERGTATFASQILRLVVLQELLAGRATAFRLLTLVAFVSNLVFYGVSPCACATLNTAWTLFILQRHERFQAVVAQTDGRMVVSMDMRAKLHAARPHPFIRAAFVLAGHFDVLRVRVEVEAVLAHALRHHRLLPFRRVANHFQLLIGGQRPRSFATVDLAGACLILQFVVFLEAFVAHAARRIVQALAGPDMLKLLVASP